MFICNKCSISTLTRLNLIILPINPIKGPSFTTCKNIENFKKNTISIHDMNMSLRSTGTCIRALLKKKLLHS